MGACEVLGAEMVTAENTKLQEHLEGGYGSGWSGPWSFVAPGVARAAQLCNAYFAAFALCRSGGGVGVTGWQSRAGSD